MVNANRNLAAYEAFGVPVWPDAQAWATTRAARGLPHGLEHCETPYLLTVPCDTPLFPLDLAARLAEALCRRWRRLRHGQRLPAEGRRPRVSALSPCSA
jgi:molybdopterin-guanine dinucleotide biosynthesis protein A